MRKIKARHIVIFILTSIGVLSIFLGVFVSIYYQELMIEYKNKTYKSTYINDYSFSDVNFNKLEGKVNTLINNALNKDINFIYNGKTVKYKLKDFEPIIDVDSVINKIKEDSKNASYSDKIKLIKGESLRKYSLNVNFVDEKIEAIIKDLASKVNCDVKEEKLVLNPEHVVVFDAGSDGYKMDIEKTKQDLVSYLNSEKSKFISDEDNFNVEISGAVIKKKETKLSLINKKISTFSTDFNNYGNRGQNIEIAVSKLNGTLLEKDQVFSFRQVVGPYTCDNGYKVAPVQSSSGYGCGGGVCQVSTTLYNAQLLAGLQTVVRYNHGYAVNYVPKGQDATVGGDWVDYQFKNQCDYPIYIVGYVENNKVVIDIWSNDDALQGKKFIVTSNRVASGGYETYLSTYQGDQLISRVLLHTSYYLG